MLGHLMSKQYWIQTMLLGIVHALVGGFYVEWCLIIKLFSQVDTVRGEQINDLILNSTGIKVWTWEICTFNWWLNIS